MSVVDAEWTREEAAAAGMVLAWHAAQACRARHAAPDAATPRGNESRIRHLFFTGRTIRDAYWQGDKKI
ncbi:MAG: hypothetical protein H5U13_10570 [Parvibaculum sp.]|nr:hypothetical protein [Parvibaculum sp.]